MRTLTRPFLTTPPNGMLLTDAWAEINNNLTAVMNYLDARLDELDQHRTREEEVKIVRDALGVNLNVYDELHLTYSRLDEVAHNIVAALHG